MSKEEDHPEYVSAAEAGRRLACDPKQVRKLAAKGLITVRSLPGVRPVIF